jgi:thiamine pyrophosphate-dependent acetolactate synthase large subunit-like protein
MLRTPGPFLVDVVCADNHVYPMIPSGKGYEDIMLEDPPVLEMRAGGL